MHQDIALKKKIQLCLSFLIANYNLYMICLILWILSEEDEASGVRIDGFEMETELRAARQFL